MWALGGPVKVTRTTHRSLTCSRRIVIRRPEWRIVIRHEQQPRAAAGRGVANFAAGLLRENPDLDKSHPAWYSYEWRKFSQGVARESTTPGRREETDLLYACPIEYGPPGRFSRPAVPWGSVPPPDVRLPGIPSLVAVPTGNWSDTSEPGSPCPCVFLGPPAPVHQALPRAAPHCREVRGPGVVPLTSGQHQAR